MNAVDAVAKMVREFPGGVAAVCARLGWNPNILRLKLCQTEARHHLTLAEAEAIQALCGKPDLVIALSESLDGSGGEVCAAASAHGLPTALAGLGDYAREMDAALADGRITLNERRRLERQMLDTVAALYALHRSVCGSLRP